MAEDRQTGRTTRILKDALEHARKGDDCYFVVHHTCMVGYCIAILCTISPDLKRTLNRVNLLGGGSIRFLPQWSERLVIEGSQLRVSGYTHKVFVDHAVDLWRNN